MFIDEVQIIVASGRGGDGSIHFRREKYINRGGPDGGDGGKGGDIVFNVNPHLNTLYHLKRQSLFKASNGRPGGPKNQTGKSADDLVIDVPPGTIIRDLSTGNQIADLVHLGQQIIICKGGRGGRGNARFATSRNQAPRLAEKGEPGVEMDLQLELKLIADVGIIGMPNAGKSSFLAAVTNAKPKIADYPFTTVVPNLGVAELDDQTTLVLADIPGLIEGAHSGLGLGDTFLKHIQRTRILIHILDGDSENIFADYSQINSELALFDPGLSKKPQIVVINKIDLPNVNEKLKTTRKEFGKKNIELFQISALKRENVMQVLWKAKQLLEKTKLEPHLEELPVYRPESKTPSYVIEKDNEKWFISGQAVERAASMTYWDNYESVRRFYRILETIGVADSLLKRGIQEGDQVQIGEYELVWSDEWESEVND